jgi:hypothetical protein
VWHGDKSGTYLHIVYEMLFVTQHKHGNGAKFEVVSDEFNIESVLEQ